jgi:hypothetical protein
VAGGVTPGTARPLVVPGQPVFVQGGYGFAHRDDLPVLVEHEVLLAEAPRRVVGGSVEDLRGTASPLRPPAGSDIARDGLGTWHMQSLTMIVSGEFIKGDNSGSMAVSSFPFWCISLFVL